MTHWFVSHKGEMKSRWREAFPDAREATPKDVLAMAGEGDNVWLMNDIDQGFSLLKTLSEKGATMVVLSYRPTQEEALEALRYGARGYAHALSTPEMLRQIQIVTSHQGIWVRPELLAKVVGGSFKALGGTTNINEALLSGLTERERAVTLAVAEGISNKEVARRLDITERTVKAHLGAVFRKLGIRDRLQLILKLSKKESPLPVEP
ncbi:response regulator transcription factor [Halomonas sp. Bachu 37]|uniref:response regulator transcription factor n=1 Tax=Halomonas kashgarensis TaxID=3084920 RepID=UPI003217B1BC